MWSLSMSMGLWTLICVVALLIQPATMAITTVSSSTPFSIDNSVVDEPRLECGAGFIVLRVNTKSHFMGRIFLKGMASSIAQSVDRRSCEIRAADACRPRNESGVSSRLTGKNKNGSSWDIRRHLRRRKAREPSNTSQGVGGDVCTMRISFDGDADGGCPPMQRQRSLNPRGISVIATVVVSFHPLFITKIDRMYRLQCFYRNAEHAIGGSDGKDMAMVAMVRAGFQVSARTPSASAGGQQSVVLPVCRYEILDGGPNGSPVAFSSLSARLYHRWRCETPNATLFCFRVHSCYTRAAAAANSGDTALLDAGGCVLDRFLLAGELDYSQPASNRLEAGQWAPAYKFADRESLFFQCQIRVWRRGAAGDCPKISCGDAPPSGLNAIDAPLSPRFARSLSLGDESSDEIDVDAELRVIEDIDDKSGGYKCQHDESHRPARQITDFGAPWPEDLHCADGPSTWICVCAAAVTAFLALTNVIICMALRNRNGVEHDQTSK